MSTLDHVLPCCFSPSIGAQVDTDSLTCLLDIHQLEAISLRANRDAAHGGCPACQSDLVYCYLAAQQMLLSRLTVHGLSNTRPWPSEALMVMRVILVLFCRYGGMFVIGMAYRGTANNAAIQKLLHFAVSDVADDVRRAAVLCLGFVLLGVPEQCPRIVSLLSQSYNPHVRYGAAMAVGICCSGTGKIALHFLAAV